MEKRRIDQLLVERGLVSSREVAQSLIMRGDVLVEDVPVTKAGSKFDPEIAIRLKNPLPRFVGRGGEKIDPMFDRFVINLAGRIAIDVGASTGGFTDAMLQRGASKVYAVDVGQNQLDRRLATDSRVVSLEQLHAKDLRPEMFNPPPSFMTMDLSFISVRKVLPTALAVLARPAGCLILVKPQFELEREAVSKGGVVKDERDRMRAVELVSNFLLECGGSRVDSEPSPLVGAKSGNQEFFLYAEFSA